MKLIFLDIDGVLNHETWFRSEDSKKEYPLRGFDPTRVELLNEITDKTGAKIVLSSTWRLGKTVEELREMFIVVGIKGELLDKTPRLNFSNTSMSVPRGCEILEWIKSNKGILGTNLLNWKDYVIIDDDGDMLFWQRKNFFQTDPTIGLTSNMVYKIINHLK